MDQLSEYFECHFSKYVSLFRKSHDGQGVLIRFSESLKSQITTMYNLLKRLIVYHMSCCSALNFIFFGLNECSCKLVANYFIIVTTGLS